MVKNIMLWSLDGALRDSERTRRTGWKAGLVGGGGSGSRSQVGALSSGLLQSGTLYLLLACHSSLDCHCTSVV